ncbi:hypothetical protein Tco_1229771 [Tanacetum coccineum]
MQMQKGEVDKGKALDADLVVTESSGTESKKHDTNSRSGNDTHAEDENIKPVNYKELMAEVQMTIEYNVFPNGQQHAEQSEFNNEETVKQDAEQCQVKIPLLDPSPNNMTTEFSNQSLKSKNISLEKTVAQFQKDFSRMEAHCIKKEIEVLESINIKLEHNVAKLLAENEKLHKQNKHLKQTYKDLYDSIKKTRVQTKDHNDSLIAQINSKDVENANLRAQIQEKVFANAALKTN